MNVTSSLNVSSLREAHCFLAHFPENHYTLVSSVRELLRRKETLTFSTVRQCIVNVWWQIIRVQPYSLQGNSDFQLKLTIAIESHILSRIHDRLFSEICDEFVVEDSLFERHCQNLTAAGVSGEDFHIPEGYSIDLMSAVVELAALDTFRCPLEKFNCLNETLTLMAAELKAAIADTYFAANGNMSVMDVTTKDMAPFLCTVLVRAKPLHLSSNLFYLRNYQNTVSPLDPSWATLLTFEEAQSHVLHIDPQKVVSKPREGTLSKRGLGMEEILQLSYSLDRNSATPSLRDRQMQQVLYMVNESTLNGCISELDQLATDCAYDGDESHCDESHDDEDHDFQDRHFLNMTQCFHGYGACTENIDLSSDFEI